MTSQPEEIRTIVGYVNTSAVADVVRLPTKLNTDRNSDESRYPKLARLWADSQFRGEGHLRFA